ncbi:MAG: GNAT family N-acetyltransferase [Niabella sp.]
MNTNKALQTIPRLWCKPAADDLPGTLLFTRSVPELDASFSFRSLDPNFDFDRIYDWVNQAYAQKFWQLKGSRSMIETLYKGILSNPQVHAFIGLVDQAPVCQIELYALPADELAGHLPARSGDCGLHILMCPPRQMQKGWSFYALRLFQEFYFSFPEAQRLFAEPDRENHAANQLAMNTGFRFLKTIELSYKTANLYCLDRQDFRPV